MKKILKINTWSKNGAMACMGISLGALLFKKKKVHAVFGALSLACIAVHMHQQNKIKKIYKGK